MIKTRAVQRLMANAIPTLPGSTSAHDQSAIRASENPVELTDENNTPGGDFEVPETVVEADNNPVIAPEQKFKPWKPNPDSVESRAIARLKASIGA